MKGVKGESRNAPGEHIKCYAGGLYGPVVLHSPGVLRCDTEYIK